jgi:hypothetical protein
MKSFRHPSSINNLFVVRFGAALLLELEPSHHSKLIFLLTSNSVYQQRNSPLHVEKSCWVDNGCRLDFNDFFSRPQEEEPSSTMRTQQISKYKLSPTLPETKNFFSNEEETKNKHTEHWLLFNNLYLKRFNSSPYFQLSMTS